MTQQEGPTGNASESIYRAPASDTSFTPQGDLLAAYVGPKNADYYERQFDRFQRGEGSMSWHWPAFFISSWWLLYRKMWLYAFLYWIVLPFSLGVLSGVVTASSGMTAGIWTYYGPYLLIAFILMPLFANRIYFGHAQGKVDKIAARTTSADQQEAELARVGGTSKIILVILPIILVALIGILAAIAFPAYQDFTIRAQVSEGLNLSAGAKAAVSEYYADSDGAFPRDNGQAGLVTSDQIQGKYVSSVAVVDGDIVITYGNDAHVVLAGKILYLTPIDETQGVLQWSCFSTDIANRLLPVACRE